MPTARSLGLTLLLLLTAQLASAQTRRSNLCALFTTAEIEKLLGTSVEPGEPAAMGTGCQWFGKDEVSYVIIQVLPPDNWIDPRQAPGYEMIQGAGKRAYSHRETQSTSGKGGWRAMALSNDTAVTVVLVGDTAKRTSAVPLLRQLLERL